MANGLTVNVQVRQHNLVLVRALLCLLGMVSPVLQVGTTARIASSIMKLYRLEVDTGNGRWQKVDLGLSVTDGTSK